ncbi:MAG: MucR family transcriptional regulator [Sandaracinaceae bacterium]|nr:MucR family transcriptional regulator [Sandaracinaceae bacterium]
MPVKKSVTPDYIVCLEDGKKLKMLSAICARPTT